MITELATSASAVRLNCWDLVVAWFITNLNPSARLPLAVMHAIDRLHMAQPFMGVRMLRNQLQCDGFSVSRQHARRLMRRMVIHAIYRKPSNE